MKTRMLSLKLKAIILAILLLLYTTYLGFYKPIPVYAVDPITITLTIDELLSIAFELGVPLSDMNALIYYFGANGVNVTIPAGGTLQQGVASALAEMEATGGAAAGTSTAASIATAVAWVVIILELVYLGYLVGSYVYYAYQYDQAVQQFYALGGTPQELAQYNQSVENAFSSQGYTGLITSNEYCYHACMDCTSSNPLDWFGCYTNPLILQCMCG